MRPRRLIRRFLPVGGAVLLTSSLMFGSTPAGADQYTNDLCIYEHRDFNTVTWPFNGKVECYGAGARANVSSAMNNQASSIDNRAIAFGGSQRMCLYDGSNQQGAFIDLGPESYLKNLTLNGHPAGGNWNDKISSVGPYPCCASFQAMEAAVAKAEEAGIQIPTC